MWIFGGVRILLPGANSHTAGARTVGCRTELLMGTVAVTRADHLVVVHFACERIVSPVSAGSGICPYGRSATIWPTVSFPLQFVTLGVATFPSILWLKPSHAVTGWLLDRCSTPLRLPWWVARIVFACQGLIWPSGRMAAGGSAALLGLNFNVLPALT